MNTSITPKSFLLSLYHLFFPTPWNPFLTAPNLLSGINLHFLKFCVNWTTLCVVWFISLNITIRVVVCICSLFLFNFWSGYCIVWLYHSLFTHSPAGKHRSLELNFPFMTICLMSLILISPLSKVFQKLISLQSLNQRETNSTLRIHRHRIRIFMTIIIICRWYAKHQMKFAVL